MFQITRPKKISKKDIYVRPLLPAFLVFMALMTIIGLSWRTARHDIITQTATTVNENATFIESTLKQRFNIYEGALRAANGLFRASDFVSRNEWTDFIHSLNLSGRYPGIRSVGYVKVLGSDEKDGFIEQIRANDLPEYTIRPEHTSGSYAPVLYVVPTAGQNMNDRNSPIIGYDMYDSEPRRKAMEKAAISGEPTFTDTFDLATATNSTEADRGFLLYLPSYRKDLPVSTSDQRLAALDGFFYAPFLTTDVFANVFHVNQTAFAFGIYDGSPTLQSNLYISSPNFDNKNFHNVKKTEIDLYGQKWVILYKASNFIVPTTVRERPLNVLTGGSIFSAALAAVIYLLIQRRTRSLAYSEQKRLEDAKDELISLASHQLRTPATAVKQYISMLKDGFAGKLSKDQNALLERAYESNERQLTIVDDLLYVARIDAGQTALQLETVNIGNLVKSVLTEQMPIIKSRKQTVQLKLPRNDVNAEVDPQYIRMIVENLLSNASKYSHEKKKIKLELKSSRNNIFLEVIDKGVGIAPENFEEVFVRFSRIPNELSRQIAGSGIGLYLAKQLALLHNGDLTFSSVHRKGSNFILRIPAQQPAKSSKTEYH